jgi:uncharacterized membrane protein
MRNRILLSAATSLFTVCLLWSATGPLDLTSWTFTSIDVPGADQSDARGINASGQIVGHYHSAQDGDRGYLFSNGVFTPIWIGDSNDARGINAEGEIVGWFNDGYTHGYLLRKGNVEQIDYPSADYTLAEDINALGDVVGFYGLGGTEHGFLLRDGVYTTIDYPGAFVTNVRGINSEGDIVGLYGMNDDPDTWTEGPFRGFLLERNGTFTTIRGNCNGINSRGQIVGSGYLLSGNLIIDFVLPPGATSMSASGITPDGQHIVGGYHDEQGTHGFVLSRKPLK